MFKLLLISKYLRRKLAPLFAALAVTICTAMVIIVISVMGGFLDTLRSSIQRMSPQVKVTTRSMNGLEHYEALCEKLKALPEVAAATPVIQTLALMEVAGQRTQVGVVGIRPEELADVVAFRDALFWRKQMFIDDAQAKIDDPKASQTQREVWQHYKQAWEQLDLVGDGMRLKPSPLLVGSEEMAGLPGAVPGIAAFPFGRRDAQGQYPVSENAIGLELTLTVVPITRKGALQDPALRKFVIVNEFKSGHYEFDSSLVFVGFDQLQGMLRMNAYDSVELDPETGEVLGGGERVPGRASEVYISGSPGVSLKDLRDAVDRVLMTYKQEHNAPWAVSETWEEANEVILGAVKNEKGLVTFLFVIISIVAIVMVATTFYMIVLEKTRDIGILRAIGASRGGIMGIFLGYGLAVGVVGSVAGFALAWGIVTYLNEIQYLLNAWFGWQMWDPRIYAFDRIPARVDYRNEAIPIAAGAIISAVVGALIPALLAARLDPVEALRHE